MPQLVENGDNADGLRVVRLQLGWINSATERFDDDSEA